MKRSFSDALSPMSYTTTLHSNHSSISLASPPSGASSAPQSEAKSQAKSRTSRTSRKSEKRLKIEHEIFNKSIKDIEHIFNFEHISSTKLTSPPILPSQPKTPNRKQTPNTLPVCPLSKRIPRIISIPDTRLPRDISHRLKQSNDVTKQFNDVRTKQPVPHAPHGAVPRLPVLASQRPTHIPRVFLLDHDEDVDELGQSVDLDRDLKLIDHMILHHAV